MRISKCLLLFTLLVTACTNKGGDRPPADASTATFVVGQVTGSVNSQTNNSLYSSIANQKLVSFSACVQDVAELQNITQGTFSIKDGNNVIATESPNPNNGCLTWSEPFAMSSIAGESYINVNRTITAVSVHKGSVTVPIGVDPWQSSADAVKDLRYEKVATTMTDAKSAAVVTANTSRLYVDSIHTEVDIVQTSEDAIKSTVHIIMEPKARHTGLDGNTVYDVLTSGQFKIRSQFFLHTANGSIPMNSLNETENTFTDGQVRIDYDTDFTTKFNKESLVELDLEIIPENAPAGLTPIKGIVSIGQLTSIVTTSDQKFRLTDFTFATDTQPTNSNLVSATVSGDGDDSSTTNDADASSRDMDFVVGQIKVVAMNVDEMASTGRPKTISLTYQAKLSNAINGEAIQGQKFSVAMDGVETTKLTDPDSGVIQWTRPISFDYFAKENYTQKDVVVKSLSSFYGDSAKTISTHVSPWEAANGNMAGTAYDDRFALPPSNLMADAGGNTPDTTNPGMSNRPSGSDIVIKAVPWSFVGRTFDLDAQLNLNEVRNYRFDISPVIPHLTSMGWKDESLGNGTYILHILVESMDANPQVLASYSKQVSAVADDIIVTVPLRFNDIRQIFARTQISFELVPVDKNTGLNVKAYVGNFDTMLGASTARCEDRHASIAPLLARANLKPNYSGLSNPDIFAKSYGLVRPSKAQLAQMGVQELDVDNFFAKKSSPLLGKLCGQFFAAGSKDLLNCQNNPSSVLAYSISEHAQKIHQKTQQSPDIAFINFSSYVNDSSYSSTDHTTGHTWSSSVMAENEESIPLLSLFGIKIGAGGAVGWTAMSSTTANKGKSQSNNTMTGEAKRLNVDSVDFNLALDVTECASILPKRINGAKILFVCANHAIAKNTTESYYLVYQDYGMSPITDTEESVAKRPFLTLIRGRDRYATFKDAAESSNNSFDISNSLPFPDAILGKVKDRYDGLFPGLLTPEK